MSDTGEQLAIYEPPQALNIKPHSVHGWLPYVWQTFGGEKGAGGWSIGQAEGMTTGDIYFFCWNENEMKKGAQPEA